MSWNGPIHRDNHVSGAKHPLADDGVNDSHSMKNGGCISMNSICKARVVLSTFTVFSLLCAIVSSGQTVYTPDAGNVGLPSNGVFSGGSIDSVQVNNGNLHVDIPLLHLPGIGMDTDIHFIYDNQLFTLTQVPNPQRAPWWTITMSRPFTLISDPLSGYFKMGLHSEQWECGNYGAGYKWDANYIDYVSYSDSNGTAHSFPASGYESLNYGPCISGNLVPTSAYSSDASGYYMTLNQSTGALTSMTDKHGNKYSFGPFGTGGSLPINSNETATGVNPVIESTHLDYANMTQIEDANGNKITGAASGANYVITDTVGRTITEAPYSGSTLPNGLIVESLGNQYSSIQYMDQHSQQQTIAITYEPVTLNLADVCGNLLPNCGMSTGQTDMIVTANLPHVITLQNGDSYTIDYVPGALGEIRQITLPTGGTIAYAWSAAQMTFGGGRSRSVVSRTVTANGQSSTWQFNGMTVTDPYMNDTVYTCGLATPCYMTAEVEYNGSASSGTKLVTKSIGYTQYGCALLPTSEVFKWEESKQTTETDSTYDSFAANETVCDNLGSKYTYATSRGNLKSKLAYDYDSSTHGTLLSNTQYSYLHDSISAYASANIADRLTQVSVYNSAAASSSTLVAQTTEGYDSFNSGGQSGLASAGWTTNHDSSYGTNITQRGLPTSITRYLSPSAGSVTTYTNYNILGQPTTSTDGNAKTANYAYTYENYPSGEANALVTTTTLPTTTSNGSMVQHIVKQYQDANTGLVVAKTDQNSKSTIVTYDSRMRQLTESRPDGGSTTNLYPYQTEVISTVMEDSSGRSATTTTTLDGLGRKSSSSTTSDAICGPMTVDTYYDLMGRVQTVSNPHCASPQLTDGYTSYSYDALGRLSEKQNPDGSTQRWNFSGSVIDFYDETSRHWQHTYDAASRLIKVLEPDGSTGALSLQTDYSYDTLGNLLRVDQWGGTRGASNDHVRKFAYDGASRLIASNNPESASAANPAAQSCSGTASGTVWTTCYVYDNNGNMINKRDNRNITITYNYDALNRLLGKTYTDWTPPVTFTYDTSTIATNGSPAYLTGQLTQATVAAGSATLAQTAPYQYDPMGRILAEQQCTRANCSSSPYQVSHTYDWVGKPTSETFPSNAPTANGTQSAGQPVTLAYGYDAAERLLTVTSNWANPDTKHPAILFQASNGSSVPAYGPMGLQSAFLGVNPSYGTTTATLQRGYDNRGRMVNGIYTPSSAPIAGSSSTGYISISGDEGHVTKSNSYSSATLPVSSFGMGGTHQVCGYVSVWEGNILTQQWQCTSQPNTGSVSITVQSSPPFTSSAAWGSNTTFASVLSSLAAGFNVAGSPVTAVVNADNTITVTSVVVGFGSNYVVTASSVQNQ
jgi:YD repeat-containing protein